MFHTLEKILIFLPRYCAPVQQGATMHLSASFPTIVPDQKENVNFRDKQGHVLNNCPLNVSVSDLTRCYFYSVAAFFLLRGRKTFIKTSTVRQSVTRRHGCFCSCLQSPLNVQEDSDPASVPAPRFKSPW